LILFLAQPDQKVFAQPPQKKKQGNRENRTEKKTKTFQGNKS